MREAPGGFQIGRMATGVLVVSSAICERLPVTSCKGSPAQTSCWFGLLQQAIPVA